MPPTSTQTTSSAPASGPLARLGGMLVHPRRTLEGILERPESTGNLVLLTAVLVAFLAQPLRTARAALLVGVAPMGGLSSLVTVVASLVLYEIVLATAIAWVLHAAQAKRPGAASSEAVFAAVAATLVPYLALVLLGASLEQAGVGGSLVSLLPHHGWRGALRAGGFTPELLLRLAVAYLPTLILLGWLVRRLLGAKRSSG